MKSKPKQIVVSVCVCVKISQNPVLHTQRVLVIASVAVHCVTALNADSTEEKKNTSKIAQIIFIIHHRHGVINC